MVDHNEVEMSRVPILVILGATGSGKSRLGIELARRFSGEIISADSMQVYKGLDIVTAKVAEEERKLAPHHMLDVVDPLTKFTVVDFRDGALPIMEDLLARRKVPIIVGGTNYYIESLLWKILISDPKGPVDENAKNVSEQDTNWQTPDRNNEKSNCEINEEQRVDSSSERMRMELDVIIESSTEELYARLQQVDPQMANRIHPHNRRKIMRSLEVFEQYGVTHSELLKAQRAAGGSGLGGPLRHQNSIILWLRCDKKVLEERLDRRVDAMLETGLVKELLDFHQRYNEERIKSNTSPDYTKGIFQSIGFKEFHDYLLLSEGERRSEKGEIQLKGCIENLKLVTKRYARNQDRWVTNRLIRRTDRQVPPIYTLDCSDVQQWDQLVFEPAVAVVSAILQGEKPSQRPLNEDVKLAKFTDSSNEECYFCEVCKRSFIGDMQWNVHVSGNKHKKVVQKQKKLMAQKKPEENQSPES